MSLPDPIIEQRFAKVVSRLRWLRWLQHTSTLGAITCALLLLLSVAMVHGWIVQKMIAAALMGLVAFGSLGAAATVLLVVLAGAPERRKLAGAVESVQPTLQDRLNTLVALEKNRHVHAVGSFYRRIEEQAHDVLAAEEVRAPFPAARPLAHLVMFFTMLAITCYYNERYVPWERLVENERLAKAVAPKPEPFELPPPEALASQQQTAWGEVRITEPARDLRVTKVDTVPLQIEAAANSALTNVAWSSAVNGAAEQAHVLPAPTEPRYAAYRPIVYIDEYRLDDWDVLTYYAKAATERSDSFASEVYFLEVRPFREDILKMPGGEHGQSYELLSELSTLINRQQHVIRQTHRHIQQPQPTAELQDQDRRKLAEAELDLQQATVHLYARIAGEMENQPVGDVLNHLALAANELERAGASLKDNFMAGASNHERSALTELVATRKNFQKFVTEHPDAFAKPKPDETSPFVAEKADKLKEMAEFRNESQAAQEFVKQAAERQRSIAQRTAASKKADYAQRAAEEDSLKQSLQDFAGQHPQAMRGVEKELGESKNALSQAAEGLRQGARNAKARPHEATEKLEQLHDAMKRQAAGQQLADAYKLKKMLDEKIKQFGQVEQKPDAMTEQQLQKAAGDAKGTLDQLKNIVDQQATRGTFGPKLGQALGDQNKKELDAKLDALAAAKQDAARQQRAGNAKQGLGQVSKAFTESQPPVLQEAQNSDALKEGEQDALDRGLSQLESLLQHQQNNHPLSPENDAKQREEALRNLSAGLWGVHGHNERTDKVVALLERELKEKGQPLDELRIQKLMDELRTFSIEVSDKDRKKPDEPTTTTVDPSRLPPAYRGRIEQYFKKLSEQR